jgi:glycosyltransferase involved in cell wall biosynthesis
MRILLVADGRSPITKNWIQMLSGLDHELVLISTYPCDAPKGVELTSVIPAGFSSLGGGQVGHTHEQRFRFLRSFVGRFRPIFLQARSVLAPLILGKHQQLLNTLIREIQPDLVHALRIPFEGMLAASVPKDIPLIVSIWGNDLTLHAEKSRGMVAQTRKTLQRADGLMADAQRDINLAKDWGFDAEKPTLVAPGSGGLDLAAIEHASVEKTSQPFKIPENCPLVINPRGFRPGSVHQDNFFKSVPLVLEEIPEAYFICTGMRGQQQAEKWVRDLEISEHVLLLPYLGQEALWRLFAKADVYVSLSSHDGTPNTFLEALACGCFPVVGDIASLREWVQNGENGLLVDPRDTRESARGIIHALKAGKLRKSANKKNLSLLRERASREHVREQVEQFYQRISQNA